ncbi:MAG TPA: transposase [Pirellulales bacterium]|nr:transposase [Pirellulales bacterium]
MACNAAGFARPDDGPNGAQLDSPGRLALGCRPSIPVVSPKGRNVLCNLSRTISIANLIKEIKVSSSGWIKTEKAGLADFYWQSGYGAFSVSQSQMEDVKAYIATQEEHHRRISFQDEFRAFLRRHAILFDERYVWD